RRQQGNGGQSNPETAHADPFRAIQREQGLTEPAGCRNRNCSAGPDSRGKARMAMAGAASHLAGMSSIDDTSWELVRRREPAADFLYGVATMRIYCRPGCPSPRPKRENVRV